MSENRFVGMEIDSIKMTLSLTTKKVQKVVKTCQNFVRSYSTTLLELVKVSPRIHYTSSGTCKYLLKIYSATTNCVSEGKNELSVSDNIKHQVKNRINLVDGELEVLQWPNFFSVEPTNGYSRGCFTDRVGSSLQWGSNIRAMVRGGENLAHECAGTTSNKIGSIFFRKMEINDENHTLSDRQEGNLALLSDRQQGSLVLPFEIGKNKERTYQAKKI